MRQCIITNMSVTFKEKQNSKKIEFSCIVNLFKKYKSVLLFFLFLVGVGFFFFIVSLFTNYFTTPFGGDYVSQQFAFYTNGYDDWWHFIKTGEFIFFDMNTYLGANNIASNSFYYLFDPFFMPILLCPRQFIPQGMAFLTIFKMALGGMAFYAYMRHFNVSQSSSRVASTMYAFCGWAAWFLWFNHFTEIIICLPLMLMGVEKVLKKERPFLLIASIALIGITNYFFMFTLVVCVFIYAIWRYFQRISQNSIQDNLKILGIGALSFVIGLMLCSVVVIPSTIVALGSDRAADDSYLKSIKEAIESNRWDLVFNYLTSWEKIDGGKEFRNYYPFIEFFYPVMSDRGTPLTKLGNETYDNVAGSIFCYTPAIILLVPALIRSFREKKYSHLVAFALFVIALFTPFSYYALHGFTKPYSRWTIFVSCCLIAYIGIYLDKLKEEPIWVIGVGGLFSVFGLCISALFANMIIADNGELTARVPIVLVMIIAIIEVSLVVALMIWKYKKPYFNTILTCLVGVEAIAMGAFTIYGHGLTYYLNANNGLYNNNALYALTSKVSSNDKSFYRSYSGIIGDSAKNDGMRNNFNSASFYHSIYNYNVRNFSEWSKLTTFTNGWSGLYVEKRQNLDTFLGMKYYYVLKEGLEYERLGVEYTPNTPFNTVDISNEYESDKYFVFRNEQHIDFGFSYDSVLAYNSENYITGYMGARNNFATVANEELYLKHGILDYLDAEEVIENHPDISLETLTGTPQLKDAKIITRGTTSSTDPYKLDYHMMDEGKVKTSTFSEILQAYKNTSVAAPKENNAKYFASISLRDGTNFPYDENGMVFYLNVGYASNTKYDIYFLDDNDNLITMDRHSDNYVTENNGRRLYRAFYIKPGVNGEAAPKVKTILFAPRYYKMVASYPIAYESYTTYMTNKMNEILEYPIENVVYKANEFKFTTNYSKERFICTQVAYDDGWKVFATNNNGETKEVKTYLTQGGFIGFVSNAGFTQYEMVYETPYLRLSNLITALGIVSFVMTIIAYYYVDVEIKKKKIINDLHF